MDMPSERSKMRSESSEYMWKTTGASINCWRIKTALESYFQERAQETLGEKFEEDHVVACVQSNIDGDDSEGMHDQRENNWGDRRHSNRNLALSGNPS